jgi:putative FmdB family regulatory protein
MPLYEYKCHSCGKTFEVIQKFADEPLKTHPECGGEVERLLSAPAFHLKGTGWYATDYGKGNGGKPKSSSDEKAEKSDKSEKSDKADASSADKSDSKSKSEAGSSASESKTSDSKPSTSPAPASSESK